LEMEIVRRLEKRFWNKVNTTQGPEACWPWKRGADKDGYGKFQFTHNHKQLHIRAHRFALVVSTGVVGDVAMHSCDNPPCCNPAHLLWGDLATNRKDCVEKGRQAKGESQWTHVHPELIKHGEKHPNAKLTDDQVRTIRREHRPGKGGGTFRLARQFGVSPALIWAVAKREAWKHVP
jgi:hypothetical protein